MSDEVEDELLADDIVIFSVLWDPASNGDTVIVFRISE